MWRRPGRWGGLSRLGGAAEIFSGSMEMLAVLNALRLALPDAHLRIYTDYSRATQLGHRLRTMTVHQLLRVADRPILLLIQRALAARDAAGVKTTFVKVAAHGRDALQSKWLTLANARADAAAKWAAVHGPDSSSVYMHGDMPFSITIDELPVYADAPGHTAAS